MLTKAEIEAIQLSWAKIAYDNPDAGRIFYSNLFAIAPDTRSLFAPDTTVQERKLVETLAFIVDILHDFPKLSAMAAELGRRHVEYGVKSSHYASVGEALLKTIQDCGGSSATPPTIEAWAKAYDVLARVMMR